MAIKTALVVDDSRLARLTLARLLERRNIRVEQAESGHAAIDYLRDHRPDVVFMDYQMPDMDGIEAIGTITGNPATARLPVYLFTAEEGEEIRNRARAAGARGLLVKPTPEDLLDRILNQAATAPAPAPAAPVVDVEAQVRDSLQTLLGQAEQQRLVPLVRRTTQEAVEARLGELWTPLLAEVRKAAREAAQETARQELQAQRPQLEQLTVVAAQRAARETAGAAVHHQIREVEGGHLAALGQEVDRRLRQVLEGPQFQDRVRQLVDEAVDQAGEGAVRAASVAAEHSVHAQVRQAVEEAVGPIEARLLRSVEQRIRQLPEPAAPAPQVPPALWTLAGSALVVGVLALVMALL